jgi:galactokinase
MSIRERTIDAFKQRFGKKPEYVVCAPGRVNLLGEHVDYNDGFVLPAAIDRSTWVVFGPSDGEQSTLAATDLSAEITFSSRSALSKTCLDGGALPGWALYPVGVSWALSSAGLSTPGAEVVYASDVPSGSGLSSSASIEISFAMMWQTLGGWKIKPLELARIAQRAEVDYVGVKCGIMDQFASVCGETGRALLLDCRSLEWRSIRLPTGIAIVVADTTIRRQLADGAYNKRRASCEEAVRVMQRDLPGLRSLRDVSLEDFNRLSAKIPAMPAKRARHVVEEIERTRKAAPLLESGDIAGFGQLMNLCHASLRDLYEVSIPELDCMASIAQSLPGCFGARLTGAGFGGCTVNIVQSAFVSAFCHKLAAAYEDKTNLHPRVYVCQASAGARLMERA